MLKMYFKLLLIDLVVFVLVCAGFKLTGLFFSEMSNGYLIRVFIIVVVNIVFVVRCKGLSKRRRLLVLLLNPVDILGFLTVCFLPLVWGVWTWAGFGF